MRAEALRFSRPRPKAKDSALLLKSARKRVAEGSFDHARALFARCLELSESNGPALFGLSALARRAGDKKVARTLLKKAAAAQPVKAPTWHDQRRPTVVRARCIESGAYCVSRRPSGSYRLRFKGGHFSVENLLDGSDVNLYVANLLGGTTDALERCPSPHVLLNTIACADLGRQSLAALSRFLEDRPGLPVINRPEAVLKTTRDENFRRLNAIEHLRFPRTERVQIDAPGAELVRRVQKAGFELPLIVRVPGRQTGRQTQLCKDWLALECAFENGHQGTEVYVIQFVDCRGDSGFYRKSRAFFIDGCVYPVAYLSNDEWQIHARDRYRVMLTNPSLQQDEEHYLADPKSVIGAKAYRALGEVGRVLGLDFAGADFTTTPDGDLFVFEANPAMRHNFDHASSFPYTRPHLERVREAFTAMLHSRIDWKAMRKGDPPRPRTNRGSVVAGV